MKRKTAQPSGLRSSSALTLALPLTAVKGVNRSLTMTARYISVPNLGDDVSQMRYTLVVAAVVAGGVGP
jgi:hypothetical protein